MYLKCFVLSGNKIGSPACWGMCAIHITMIPSDSEILPTSYRNTIIHEHNSPTCSPYILNLHPVHPFVVVIMTQLSLRNIEDSRAARLAGNLDTYRFLSCRTRTLLWRDKERYVRDLAEEVEGNLNANQFGPAY